MTYSLRVIWLESRPAAEREHLVRQTGVSGPGSHNPHLAILLVKAIPDPAAASDLDLPLRKLLATDLSRGEVGAKLVMPFRFRRSGMGAHELPCPEGVGGRVAAELLPATRRGIVMEPNVPVARPRRRGYPVTPLRTHSRTGAGTGP
jgi:hypothetical protein